MERLSSKVAAVRKRAIAGLTDDVSVSVVTEQAHSKLADKPSVLVAVAKKGLGALVMVIDAEEFGLEAQLELLGDLGFRSVEPTAHDRARAALTGPSSRSGPAT